MRKAVEKCIKAGIAILGQSLLAGFQKLWFYFFSANKGFKPQRTQRAQSCFFLFSQDLSRGQIAGGFTAWLSLLQQAFRKTRVLF
jgi:hypothetical protein